MSIDPGGAEFFPCQLSAESHSTLSGLVECRGASYPWVSPTANNIGPRRGPPRQRAPYCGSASTSLIWTGSKPAWTKTLTSTRSSGSRSSASGDHPLERLPRLVGASHELPPYEARVALAAGFVCLSPHRLPRGCWPVLRDKFCLIMPTILSYSFSMRSLFSLSPA